MSGPKPLLHFLSALSWIGSSSLVGLHTPAPSRSAEPQTWRPITFLEKTISHAAQDRIDPVISERLFAVRSNGSMVWKITSMEPNGTSVGAVLLDWDDRVFVDIFDSLKSTSTSEISERNSGLLRLRIPDCARYKEGWQKFTPTEAELLGFRVEGYREIFKGTTIERLVAPALDCYAVREVERSPRGAWNETYVVSVQLGEPEDSLFQIPRHYVERPPVEINGLYKKSFGVEYYPGSSLSEAESLYQRTKRPRPQ